MNIHSTTTLADQSHILKETQEADNLTKGPFLVQHPSRECRSVCSTFPHGATKSNRSPFRWIAVRQVARYEGTWVFDGCFDRCEHGLGCAVSTTSVVCCFKSHPDNEFPLSIRKQTAQVVLTAKRLQVMAIEQSSCTSCSSRPQHELRVLRTLMLRSIAMASQRLRATCIESESRLISSLGDCRGGSPRLA
ncbi:uncharacterized protein K444DRAFT_248619 [Hyaloscypha bicolor E]|uniref:Uncharacterized protein n=1 Tax=Hyaloscypha bicolor E TaxID=1095630 RepID=A0A2J6SMH1_9HELO|nr:uncharacterized protein K444DRAFT_248619 [Hyaloscypha bicolor E]PMD51964.1 hypothetical protein K444DRAFT_248619 [Hyaloscypha bicolor E]